MGADVGFLDRPESLVKLLDGKRVVDAGCRKRMIIAVFSCGVYAATMSRGRLAGCMSPEPIRPRRRCMCDRGYC